MKQSTIVDRLMKCDGLGDIIEDIGGEQSTSLAVITNIPTRHPVRPLVDIGFVVLPSFPDCVLDLKDCFEEQIAIIPQADRSSVRRNIRRFEKAGHSIERLQNTQTHAEALMSAYAPMFDRAKVKWQRHTLQYFSGLSALGPSTRVSVAKTADGEIIGFAVGFLDGDSFQAGRIGVGEDFHRKDAIYFRLLYSLIQDAISQGAKTVSLGPTGYRMKRHLGARYVPMQNLVYPISPLWTFLLQYFARFAGWLLKHLRNTEILEDEY